MVISTNAFSNQSTCYGTTSNGKLDNGQELPASGPNFETYSRVARIAGRTYVHSTVKSIIVNSYKALETESSQTRYLSMQRQGLKLVKK